ncbi:11213_t:CDS:2, partial [Dentiscutata heterogama]
RRYCVHQWCDSKYKGSLRFLLTNTKVPRHTKTLVENVRKRLENFPKNVNLILDAIHSISESFKEILENETSHPSLDKVREIAAQYDLHTKLTGAGGGGCAVTFIRNDVSKEQIENVKKDLNASPHCFECYETSIGGHGVGVLDTCISIDLQEFLKSEKNKLTEITGWKYFA